MSLNGPQAPEMTAHYNYGIYIYISGMIHFETFNNSRFCHTNAGL